MIDSDFMDIIDERINNPSNEFKRHMTNLEFANSYNNNIKNIMEMSDVEKFQYDKSFNSTVDKIYDIYKNSVWLDSIITDEPCNTIITLMSIMARYARNKVPYVIDNIPIMVVKIRNIRFL
jgi:hypothetical protein